MSDMTQADFPSLTPPLYLLLEHDDDLLQRVYEQEPSAVPQRLFANTELDAHRDQGPLLVPLSTDDALLAAYRSAPSDWPGILLACDRPEAELLEHLQRLLIVRFDGNRKALLRYYDPRVASYFFPACDVQSSPAWLGPIRQVAWHGGTWADSAADEATWHCLNNPEAANATPMTAPMPLDDRQTRALERQQLERFVYDWQQRHPQQPFTLAWVWLHQGLAVGFDEYDDLTAYLDLRAQYPGHTDHPAPSTGETRQRLQQLRDYLEASPASKEIHL
ncbi:DUF4123 domain-containing protein [Pseudomonas indica]|uniref:DUF4123 domain-containing protein n=1 Tax=Pseudomonas indica TaxID=137658 RepID=A0A1G9QEZ7_9PSED|nr:DUF4123 domain-containing protein [Pseudomonas indica]PAU60432.1 hypothetical protein BZL42_10410 [Pseudomonas indica]SDM09057.1 protein of unknown function [Pseudomonas indica]